MVEFKLPDVGEGMHEAEIVRWLVQPGDLVKLDQIMLEIQTDKALVEIPAPVAGKVIELKTPVGKMAQLGEVLIVIEPQEVKATAPAASASSPAESAASASIHQQLRDTAPVSVSSGAPALAVHNSSSAVPSTPPRPVRAAPAVRKLALELDVDLTQVKSSSGDGRILMDDVKNYAANLPKNGSNGATAPALATTAPVAAPPPPANLEEPVAPDEANPVPLSAPSVGQVVGQGQGEEERRPLVGLRRRIAERMEIAWRTIPHVTSFDEVDATGLIALREQLKASVEKRGQRLTYLPLIIKATLVALKEFPIFNSSLNVNETSREIVYKRYYHIGIATSTPDGLLVPVVREANRKTTFELASEIARLSEGARKRSLTPPELSGSTFTITNFGSYGSAVGTPIINPPEVAILGVGRIQDKVVPLNGQPVVRSTMPICISFDHRVIDGADSGAFMNRIKELLENPALLLLEC